MKRVFAALAALLLLTTWALAELPAEDTAAPTAHAAPSDMLSEKPTDTPTEKLTDSPAEKPTDTPAEKPAETPSETLSDAPSETPAQEPSDETGGEAPAGNPADDLAPRAAAEGLSGDAEGDGLGDGDAAGDGLGDAFSAIPDDAEAWMVDPADETGMLAGKLEELLAGLDRDSAATIYMRVDTPITVEDMVLSDVAKVEFLPDEDIFEKDKFAVRLSESEPEEMPRWLRVAVEEIEEEGPPTDPDPEDEIKINVLVKDYVPDGWSNVAPTFTLSGIPDGAEGYSYDAILYDARRVPLSGNTYVPEEGLFMVCFVIIDPMNDFVSMSEKYSLRLDFTPPAYVSALLREEGKAVFDVSSGDVLSGLNAYSVDGGITWVPIDEDGVYTHTGTLGEIYPPGAIRARDNAGNIAEYPGEFAIPKPIPYPSGGGGGGGGSGSGDSIKHTGDEDVDTTPYDALELTLPEGPMGALTLGGQPLDLTLALDSAEGFYIDDGYEPKFTASLARWAEGEGEEAQPDTLVLEALVDPVLTGGYTYLWRFNGAVHRMLFNSGIDYIVLRNGDRVAALSTAGFTAGAEYIKLKAGGVSTRKFSYALWMTGSAQDSERAMVMEADVEGEVYPLTDDTEQAMYYYDLYYGPAEMMNVPFGAWQAGEGEAS